MLKKNDINEKSKRTDKDTQTGPKYSKFILISAALVVAIVAIVLITAFSQNSKSYVAKVGKEKISVMEFNSYLSQVKSAMLSEAQINPDTPEAENFWKTANFNGLSATEEAKRQALDALREMKIQVIKAKEKNLKLTSEEKDLIESQIDQLIKQSGSKAEANESLMKAMGLDIDGFRQAYTEQYLAYKLYMDETAAMNISDDEAKSVYDSDTKSFDKVTVRHILISKRDINNNWLSEEEIAEAENKAKEILEKINAGEDMEKLAKEHSADPPVEENGGVYTFTKFDSYVDEFKDWAIKANVGDTGIVETSYGYHVMRLEDRESIPFEDVKENIKSSLMQEKFIELLEEWKKDPAYAVQTNDKVYNSL